MDSGDQGFLGLAAQQEVVTCAGAVGDVARECESGPAQGWGREGHLPGDAGCRWGTTRPLLISYYVPRAYLLRDARGV